MSKPRFRDIEQVRSDLKSSMPLHEFIELVDGASLERVNDELYKKKCDLYTHPVDADGSRDSTASFTVCPQKELWYCFGCGSGGDRIQYIETKFNMDHIDAIYKVAEVQGFDLSQYYAEYSDEEKAINQLFDENSKARDIAHNCLLNTPRAIEYLTGRGISLESIKEFKLGYVPPMTENKVVIFDQIPNSKSLQLDKADRLSDAILFPVTDTTGRMRYFQSRPFNPATGQKYLGVSDKHPLYSEEDRLYGFHIARRKVREYGGRLVGVEGAPDTIVCNQHGVPAAGIMGTAANINTFALLDRFKIPELVLLLDGDKAGRSRSVSIAEKYLTFKTNVRLKIATLPDGLDPDETINKHGVDIIHKCINEAKHAIEFLIDHLWHSKDYSGFTGKIDFVTEVYKYISVLTDPIIKKVAISHIACLVGFDIVEIEDHYTRTSAQTSGAILYNADGEELIMAEMLRNQDFAIDMFSKFIKDDWYLARHKALFQLLKTAKHADIESLFVLAKNNNLDNIITQDWLNRLTNKHGNVEFAVDDVYDKLIRRRAKERLVKIDSELNDMTQKPALIIDQGIGQLYNATIKQTEESIFDAPQQVNDAMKLINERMKNPMMKIGYDLGPNFKKLTSALLGIQTKTLTVVSANQSVGKTQIVENWVMNFSVNDGIPTLWISLEMDAVRMTFRHLAMLSGLDLRGIQTGNISIENKTKILDPIATKLSNAPFYISERGHDIDEALAIARRYVTRFGVKVIAVDYVQLQYISSGKYAHQRHRELGMMSKSWKQFAKEMDVAVILISQLSKDALSADIAKAEHGAGSYEIAQDADNYITLKEKDSDEIEQNGIERGNITLNIDKNRMGEADILIDVYSQRENQRMKEV